MPYADQIVTLLEGLTEKDYSRVWSNIEQMPRSLFVDDGDLAGLF